MRAEEKDIKKQSTFCKDLMDRLNDDVKAADCVKPTVVQNDIVRLRRELAKLYHMTQYDYRSK